MIGNALFLAGAIVTPLPAGAQAATADVGVNLRTLGERAAVGDDALLLVVVTNHGPAPASDVVVELDLAEGLVAYPVEACEGGRHASCPLGGLQPAESREIRLTAGVAAAGALESRAVVRRTETDPNPANDQATTTTPADGRSCDRVGTPGGDDLVGSRRGAVVCGLAGDDLLVSGGGRERVLGGSGNDVVAGGALRDSLDGGEGTDVCARDLKAEAASRCERDAFGAADPLPLAAPSLETVGYGYHESLFRTAIGMRPLPVDGPRQVVMSSRGRGTGSTTSVDVVIPDGDRIVAPITGTVVAVVRYRLYCESLDWKVVIRPRARPDLRVLVLHMGRPSAQKGDEVTAGVSGIGRARSGDFPNAQKNRYFPAGYPHVHIEVERDRASPTPGCKI